MGDVLFHIPAKVLFGSDVVNRAGQVADEYGKRALLVTDSAMYEGGHIHRVQDLLEKNRISCILFDEVPSDANTATATELVALARASKAQLVIGLGGMRVLSTAKMAALTAPSARSVYQVAAGEKPDKAPLPYIEIPASFRNHFMLKDQFVITDGENRKTRQVYTHRELTRAILFDPALSSAMSVKYAAAAMLDTLLACIEGYLSSRSTMLSDVLFLRAIDILKETIDSMARTPDDAGHRYSAGEAGLLCAIGLSMSSQGAGGALSYTVNSRYQVPKSWTATVLLPHILDYHAGIKPAKVAKIARALGEDIPGLDNRDDAAQASTVARRLIGKLDLPGRLRDFDLSLDDMVEVCDTASAFDMVSYAPVPMTSQDLYELVKQAY